MLRDCYLCNTPSISRLPIFVAGGRCFFLVFFPPPLNPSSEEYLLTVIIKFSDLPRPWPHTQKAVFPNAELMLSLLHISAICLSTSVSFRCQLPGKKTCDRSPAAFLDHCQETRCAEESKVTPSLRSLPLLPPSFSL